jgi:hypothetical protein
VVKQSVLLVALLTWLHLFGCVPTASPASTQVPTPTPEPIKEPLISEGEAAGKLVEAVEPKGNTGEEAVGAVEGNTEDQDDGQETDGQEPPTEPIQPEPDQETTRLETTIQSLREQLEKQKQETKDVAEKLAVLTIQNDQCQRNVDLEKRNTDHVRQLWLRADDERDTFEGDWQKCSTELENLEKSSQMSISRKQEQYEELLTSYDLLKKDLLTVEGDKEHAERKLTERQGRIAKLVSELDTATAEIDERQIEIDQKERALAEKDQKVADLQRSIDKRTEEIEEKNKNLSELQAVLENRSLFERVVWLLLYITLGAMLAYFGHRFWLLCRSQRMNLSRSWKDNPTGSLRSALMDDISFYKSLGSQARTSVFIAMAFCFVLMILMAYPVLVASAGSPELASILKEDFWKSVLLALTPIMLFSALYKYSEERRLTATDLLLKNGLANQDLTDRADFR